MAVSCYIHKLGTTVAEFLTLKGIPRLGELLSVPGHTDDFRVVAIRHSAHQPSGRELPAVHLYLTPLARAVGLP
jgi:hypothetical protein